MPYKDPEVRKAKQRFYAMRYYETNKQKCTDSKRRNRQRIVQRIRNYKTSKGCSCGETHPACLEFHHRNGDKEANIADMANRQLGWEKILKEIKKCEVVCANCHRKLHFSNVSHRTVRSDRATHSGR